MEWGFVMHCDWSEAAIRQFYATCFFHPDHSITWMTHHSEYTISYEDFATALGMPGTAAGRYRIHEVNEHFEPMPVAACGCRLISSSTMIKEQAKKEPSNTTIF